MDIQEAIDHAGFGRFQRRLFAVCGVTWAADAAEIFLISFALPQFRAEFDLSTAQAGLVVTSTFAGMLVGAWFWGTISDRIGRRLGFQVTVAIFAIFGLLSALSPNVVWLVVLRAITGFGLGGALPLDFSLFAEYLPSRNRGRWLVLLESFWAVGTVIAAGLGLLIVPNYGWRWLLATSAVAALLVLWVRARVPESARYLLARGRRAEARALLERLAADNGTTLPDETLTLPPAGGRTSLVRLVQGRLRQTTLMLWAVWFLIAFAYYGIFVWLPEIFVERYEFLNSYRYVFYLALIQLPGYFSAAWLVDRWGRKPVLAGYLAAGAVFTYLWALTAGIGLILAAAGLMSFFALGAWAALYAYTPESYPTQLRASGMGIASGYARIGGVIAPVTGGALLSVSLVAALSVFAAAFLLAAVVTALYGTETRDLPLGDTLAETRPPRPPGPD